MSGTDDLKHHANSSHDFYALLSLSPAANSNEIRTAYRKTALKYHPDKVGANEEALEKFHLLQIAYDVLSDPQVKELYDNARRARQQQVERNQAYEGRRKWMKEDLERRESGAAKRKREDVVAEDAFERELRRLAEDGKRRRKLREEELKQEALLEMEEERRRREGDAAAPSAQSTNGEVSDLDRSVTLRFPQNQTTRAVDKEAVVRLFERFGPIEEAVLRDKRIKVEGQKHRQPYTTAVIVYKSVVGAHAAVSDFGKVAHSDEAMRVFEEVSWAGGKEPECIPKILRSGPDVTAVLPPEKGQDKRGMANGGDGKVPSFSFKAAKAQHGPSLDEVTMIRLKNAERRRMEEKIRREEEEAAAQEG